MMKNKFDIATPSIGHFNRFQDKLAAQNEQKKPRRHWYKYIAVAASVLLIFGFFLNQSNQNKGLDLADLSPKMEDTQDYFTKVIHQELEEVAKIKSTENQQIINDALAQLELLENDYNKQKIALANNSENKNVIFAMISNYQQRIEVLQNLLQQLNKFDHIKKQYNETNKL